MAQNDGKKNKRSRLYLFIMIFLLLLLNLGLIYNLVTENEELKTELVDTQQELQTLDQLKQELELDLTDYKGKNAALDSVITERDAEITRRITELETILKQKNLTQQQYRLAKSKIADLEKEKNALTEEIERLSKENKYLQDENYVMQKQIEAERKKVSEMEGVITERNKEVAIGKRIFFKELSVKPLRSAVFGEYKVTDKLSRLEKIEVSFVLGNNDLADKGEKMLYVQVITPNKSTLTNSEMGSGTFNYEGGDRLFTAKKVVNFQNANEKGSLSIPKTEGMVEGRYVVNIYSDSHKMETQEFTLR